MIRYSMTQVENFTGIKAHTLRIWEKRYGYILAKRTSTNIRFYSEEQLKDLLRVSMLLRNGIRISSIVKMSTKEIEENISRLIDSTDATINDGIDKMSIAMLNMDELTFTSVLEDSIRKIGFAKSMTDLVYPFLAKVGFLWTSNTASPAQEHFISNLIRQKIISEIDAIENPGDDARSIVLFLMEKESHELGLLFAYYLAKNSGWKVFYLGQNVPHNDLLHVEEITSCDLFFTTVTIIRSNETIKALEQIADNLKTPLLVAGSQQILKAMESNKGIHVVSKPDDFSDFLESYRA